MSDLSIGVNFEGSGIEVDAEFGYSNTRYVSPSEYTGELTVVPSHERRILETTGKMLNGNVTVEAAPTSEVIFTENGEYLPPEGEVGFSRVSVDVEQLGVLIKTETLDHNESQNQGDPYFWYRYFNLGAGIFFLFFDNNEYLNTNDKNRALDMICFVTSPDAEKKSVVLSRNRYQDPRNTDNSWSLASAGTTIRVYQIPYNL